MPDEQQLQDGGGWRALWAPIGNTLLVGFLLYKLISLIVDGIDRFIHPEDYKKKEKKKLKSHEPN